MLYHNQIRVTMKNDVPSLSELKNVPAWPLVAFSARLARRAAAIFLESPVSDPAWKDLISVPLTYLEETVSQNYGDVNSSVGDLSAQGAQLPEVTC
jgi:hypothetical protein